MRQADWGLSQAGILTNKRLWKKLAPFGYFEHVNTPGVWYHELCPISFILVVDDFGVKYKNKDDIDHLVASINTTYTVTKDWSSDLFLQDCACLVLRKPDNWYLNAWLNQEKNTRIWPRSIKTYPNVPVLAGTKTIRDRSTSSTSNHRFPPPRQRGHPLCVMHCGQHSILCSRGWYDLFNGLEHDSKWANNGH